jgi:3,4-dihydroxy 2-butanone 4-phosphate synthase/GTP cyclohydrolase II
MHAYVDRASGATHLVLVKGSIPVDGETLVRVHEPLSVLDFLDPGSKQQSFSIDEAQAALAKNGHGVIVLMHRPEDGEALLSRLSGQNKNSPRAQGKWDPRTYGIGAQILRDLGVTKMRLLSSPRRMPSMTGFDLEVTGFVPSPAEL